MSKKSIYKSKIFRRYSTRFWWFKKLSKKDYNQIQYWQDLTKKQLQYYSIRLKSRKALSLFYGAISKKQLDSYYLRSLSLSGKSGSVLFQSLEKRLDVSLFRSSFAMSIQTAKQLIKHKQVLVNQCKITSPSYLLKPGDIVSIDKRYFTTWNKFLKLRLNSLKIKHPKAHHLEINPKILTFIYLFSPQQIAIPYTLQKQNKRIIKQPLFDIDTISQTFYPLKG